MSFNLGFDWNGNRKHDSFDDYMNMKVANSTGSSGESYPKKENETDSKKQRIMFGNKQIYDANKHSDGVTIIKCLVVIGLCIVGFVVPIKLGLEDLGIALCLFGTVAVGVAILKNT